jgi:hypothetical protein
LIKVIDIKYCHTLMITFQNKLLFSFHPQAYSYDLRIVLSQVQSGLSHCRYPSLYEYTEKLKENYLPFSLSLLSMRFVIPIFYHILAARMVLFEFRRY